MKILFVVALPIELKMIKQEIKKLEIINIQVDFLSSWVWSYNTIYSLKEYIDKNWNPDFIINLWVCGKTDNKNAEFIQIYRIKNLADKKEKICPVYFEFTKLESIACSENIVTDKKDLLDEIYVDMESFWVDFVSTKEKIPYIILKIPFDSVWEDSKKVELKELENKFLNFPYKELINSVKKYTEKNSKKEIENLDFYKDFFTLTYSETEILKRNYNKFIAYNLNFKEFFENNKDLPKEKFLEKINIV